MNRNRFSFPAQRLLAFIDQEAVYPRGRLIAFAVITGIANGLLLAVINYGAGKVGEFAGSGAVQVQLLAMFAVILAIFCVHQKIYT